MPFKRPSLVEIFERTRAELIEASPESENFRVSLADIHARAISGCAHLLHGHAEAVATTLLPDSKEPETIERWARIMATVRKEATPADGKVIFTGQDGKIIPEGTRLQASEQRAFKTIATATIVAGTVTARVVSEEPGARMNIEPAAKVTLISPIAGISSDVVIGVEGVRGGSDQETDRELQRRYLYRFQNPPRGGHITDYIRWTEEVPGVAKAFVFRHLQGVLNQVGVTFTITGDNSIPTISSEIVQRVRDHLEAVRPEAAKVTVFVPIAHPLNLTLKIWPDTPAVRSAVTAEVKDLLSREAGVGGAFATDGTIYLSHLREAIGQAEGEHHHELTAPSTNIVPTIYEFVTFGEITWLS